MSEIEAGLRNLSTVLPPKAGEEEGDETRRLADRLGICLSALCLVHCLATPLLILLLPSIQFLETHESWHEGFHLTLMLVLPVLALAAFLPGYRRHGDKRVFFWAVPGLILVAIVALAFEHVSWTGSLISILGSLMLIRAHVINRQQCACCEVGHGLKKGRVKFPRGSLRIRPVSQGESAARRKLLTTPRR